MRCCLQETKRSPNDLIVKGIERRHITLDEALAAKEVFVTGSTIHCVGIVSINGHQIADGTPGISSVAMAGALEYDQQVKEGGDQHTEIPYGMLLGMRAQMM